MLILSVSVVPFSDVFAKSGKIFVLKSRQLIFNVLLNGFMKMITLRTNTYFRFSFIIPIDFTAFKLNVSCCFSLTSIL